MRAYVLAHQTHQSSLQIRHHFQDGHALMYFRFRTRSVRIKDPPTINHRKQRSSRARFNLRHVQQNLICRGSLEPALKSTDCVSLSRLSVLCTDIGGMSQVSDYSKILVLPTSENIVTHRQQRNCSRQLKMETWLT